MIVKLGRFRAADAVHAFDLLRRRLGRIETILRVAGGSRSEEQAGEEHRPRE